MKKLYLLLWSFIVTSFAIGQSSPTDYFRTVQSGTWNNMNTWESSPDGTNWTPATLTPTSLANVINILSPHIVTITAPVAIDQVVVYGGAILDHSSGTLTVEDGGGYDIDVNGTFVLSSIAPQFGGGSPVINIATGGMLRVSAAGLTGAGTGVNASNYVYNDNSILEYTLTGAFSTDNVTYFPNAAAGIIPIFRVTANSPTVMNVGSNNPTTFNGLFQISGTATVRWQNSGNKIFRNGINNTGNMDFEAASIGAAKFKITGSTARLAGTGALLVPTTGGLEIGNNSTVILDNNKTITGNISLLTSNSLIDLGNNDLTVSGTVSITQVSSYVKTTGAGVLTLNSIGLAGKLFPIGNSTVNPLYIIHPVGTSSYSARVVEPIIPTIYNNNSAVLRTWYISSPAIAPSASISFGYSYPADAGPFYNNSGPVEAGVNIGGTWSIHQINLTPAVFPIVPGTFIVTPSIPINYFNGTTTEFPFVVANMGAILTSDYFIVCRALKQNDNAFIDWKIQDAGTVNSFEVQRSVNSSSYQTIATMDPVLNQTEYSYADLLLPKGTYQYRIKVNRNNGGVLYSNIVVLINDTKGLFMTSLLPDPVKDNVEIIVSSAKATVTSFTVYDISGKPVKQWQSNIVEGTNYIQKDLIGLPAGLYHLLATTAETKAVIRFVKE